MSSDHLLILCLFLLATLLALFFIALPRLRRGPGTLGTSLLVFSFRFVMRILHQVRYEGLEHVPDFQAGKPLVVVSNHTGGVDPILIQCGCPFFIRWMMAADYMSPSLAWFWRVSQVIPVARTGRDTAAVREAIRHVRDNRVVGIFPEGGIVRPAEEIRPFLTGAGLIIAKARAPVLLVWVHGTPQARSAFGSVFRPSRACVQFLGLYDCSMVRDPERIMEFLRRKIAEASGWPLNDELLPSARKSSEEQNDESDKLEP